MRGIEGIPATRWCAVIGNHAGVVGLDAVMVQVAILDEHPAHRHLRALGADLVFDLPFVGALARKSGATLACPPDAEQLLRRGGASVSGRGVQRDGQAVLPGYRLQQFGRGGFVSAALTAGSDHPVLDDRLREDLPGSGQRALAGPTAGSALLPDHPDLPVVRGTGGDSAAPRMGGIVGEPVDTSTVPIDPEDPMLVFEMTGQVRESIQHNLYRMLVRRRGIFR